jgi:hypothetical protein
MKKAAMQNRAVLNFIETALSGFEGSRSTWVAHGATCALHFEDRARAGTGKRKAETDAPC